MNQMKFMFWFVVMSSWIFSTSKNCILRALYVLIVSVSGFKIDFFFRFQDDIWSSVAQAGEPCLVDCAKCISHIDYAVCAHTPRRHVHLLICCGCERSVQTLYLHFTYIVSRRKFQEIWKFRVWKYGRWSNGLHQNLCTFHYLCPTK